MVHSRALNNARLILATLMVFPVVAGCQQRGPQPGQEPSPEAVAHYEEACAAIDNGYPALAKTNAKAAYTTDPTHAHAACLYARLLVQEKRYDEALEICEQLTGWYPQYIPGHLLQGILWEIKGDREKAEGFWKRVYDLTRELHTRYDSNICAPIAVYLSSGKERALQWLEDALARFPEDPNVLALKELVEQDNRNAITKWFVDSSKASRPALDEYLPTDY